MNRGREAARQLRAQTTTLAHFDMALLSLSSRINCARSIVFAARKLVV